MNDEKLLQRELTPRNLLSFGPDTEAIPLRALNVLIGPNGSGKSNDIEVVALLRAAANDVRSVVRKGGGVSEWIWKGAPNAVASLEALVAHKSQDRRSTLRHIVAFRAEHQAFRLDDERIEDGFAIVPGGAPYTYYALDGGWPVARGKGPLDAMDTHLEPDRSVLSQVKDAVQYPELWYLETAYARIRIYREWSFGRNAVFREPQKADMRNDRLEEDFSNLGLVLNRLRRTPKAKNSILEGLHDLYEGIDDFDVSIEGGTVQAFFTEGDFTIPAIRLSDGTLRYLCLLAILLDPDPPPLICIEEPELGLHPDLLPKVADLLVAASERTQLIVTTHSDILVDALTELPEAVVVCEKHQGQTQMRRLDAAELTGWLDKYRLGDYWLRGGVGGTRW